MMSVTTRSMRMRESACSCRASVLPVACRTSKPSPSSIFRQISKVAGSSSTRSTVIRGRGLLWAKGVIM